MFGLVIHQSDVITKMANIRQKNPIKKWRVELFDFKKKQKNNLSNLLIIVLWLNDIEQIFVSYFLWFFEKILG